MTKPKNKYYPKELKIEALEMLRTSGKSMAQIERELGINPNLPGKWKVRYDIALDEMANKALYPKDSSYHMLGGDEKVDTS